MNKSKILYDYESEEITQCKEEIHGEGTLYYDNNTLCFLNGSSSIINDIITKKTYISTFNYTPDSM